MRLSFPLLLVAIGSSACVCNAALVDINFNGGTEFAANFRDTSTLPFTGHTTQGNGYVSADHTQTVAGNHYQDTVIYDTTPANASQQSLFSGDVTIFLDVRAAQAGSSIGFFIINPSETGGQQLFFFNWDTAGGPNELFRLTTDTNLTEPSINTTVYNQQADAGLTAGSGLFTTISLRYWEGAPGEAFMNFTAGSFNSGDVSLGAGTYLPTFEIGIRAYDGVDGSGAGEIGGVDYDNFRVIPEPGATILLAVSALGLLRRRVRA